MFTIVPRTVGPTHAEVFVGCFEHAAPPHDLYLNVTSTGVPVSTTAVRLRQVLDGGNSPPISWWAGPLAGLKPETTYDLRLTTARDEPLASAWLETVPAALPTSRTGSAGHRPFTVWLSSCFSARRSPAGLEDAIAAAYGDSRRRPHLKFLVGDQVYLDELFVLIYSALTERALRTRFNAQYARTWTHPGFSALLASGGAYFLPDDHELWNNYPHDPFGLPLRGKKFWDTWYRLAYEERCLAIQPPVTGPVFDIGQDLSFYVADFRSTRGRNLTHFIEGRQMDELEKWLDNLRCPGVLVVQQPIIAGRGGSGDRKLPNYGQYWTRLLPALRRCQQDLVVLAGDSHAGHVASTSLNGDLDPRGPRLIQVVSSPLALVSPLAAATPHRWPTHLPLGDASGKSTPVRYEMTVPTYRTGPVQRGEEHGTTVSFWKAGHDQVGMRVQTWLARASSRAAAPVWETTLAIRAPRELGRPPEMKLLLEQPPRLDLFGHEVVDAAPIPGTLAPPQILVPEAFEDLLLHRGGGGSG